MSRDGQNWVVLSRELLADVLELADAELEVVRDEIGAVGRRAARALLLIGAALALAFWLVALLGFVLVAALSLWLPPWGAGLVVAGVFLLLAAILLAIAISRLKRIESPVEIFFRHLRGHLDWWRREVRLHPGTGGKELP
jgi:putative superfamily III holin-X